MAFDKDKILIFIRDKFWKEGFYKTSMDELAREMKISKKTIYRYFPTKEKLLEEICVKTFRDIDEQIESTIRAKGSVVYKFAQIINIQMKYFMHLSEKWSKDLKTQAPYLMKNVEEFRKSKIQSILAELIDHGKKDKIIEDFPTPIIILSFVATIHSVLDPDFLINNKFSFKQAISCSYELLMNGILTNKGKKEFKKIRINLKREINSTI